MKMTKQHLGHYANNARLAWLMSSVLLVITTYMLIGYVPYAINLILCFSAYGIINFDKLFTTVTTLKKWIKK